MLMNSINTNVSAMMALQALNAVNRELFQVQTRISTGLKVSSVRDDPATWAIAQNQRAELSGLNAVSGSLARGQSVADVALSAGETISDLLIQMKEKALAATDPTLSATAKAALSEDYAALRKQIDIAAANAEFGGVNLISSGSSGQVKALANTSASSTIDIAHVDLSTTGSILSGLPADLSAVTSTDVANLGTAIQGVSGTLAKIGSGAKALESHQTFIGKLQDTMEASIGRLVDADLAKESARLQALQVRQQLAMMALSMANRGPQLLLQLFQR